MFGRYSRVQLRFVYVCVNDDGDSKVWVGTIPISPLRPPSCPLSLQYRYILPIVPLTIAYHETYEGPSNQLITISHGRIIQAIITKNGNMIPMAAYSIFIIESNPILSLIETQQAGILSPPYLSSPRLYPTNNNSTENPTSEGKNDEDHPYQPRGGPGLCPAEKSSCPPPFADIMAACQLCNQELDASTDSVINQCCKAQFHANCLVGYRAFADASGKEVSCPSCGGDPDKAQPSGSTNTNGKLAVAEPNQENESGLLSWIFGGESGAAPGLGKEDGAGSEGATPTEPDGFAQYEDLLNPDSKKQKISTLPQSSSQPSPPPPPPPPQPKPKPIAGRSLPRPSKEPEPEPEPYPKPEQEPQYEVPIQPMVHDRVGNRNGVGQLAEEGTSEPKKIRDMSALDASPAAPDPAPTPAPAPSRSIPPAFPPAPAGEQGVAIAQDDLVAEIQKLKSILAYHTEEKNRFDQEKASWEKELVDRKEATSKLVGENQRLKAQLDGHSILLSEVSDLRTELRAREKQGQDANDRLRVDLEKFKQENRRLVSEVGSLRAQREDEFKVRTHLESRVSEMKETIMQLKQTLSEAPTAPPLTQEEIERLSRVDYENQDLRQKLQALQAENLGRESTLEAQRKELEEAREDAMKIAMLEKNETNYVDRIRDLEAKLEASKAEGEGKLKEYASLAESKESENQEIMSRLKKVVEQFKLQRAKLQSQAQDMAKVHRQNEAMKAHGLKAKALIGQMKSRLQQSESRLKSIPDLQNANSNLRTQLQQSEARMRAMDERLAQLDSAEERLQEEERAKSEAQNSLSDLTSQLDSRNERIESMQEEIQTLYSLREHVPEITAAKNALEDQLREASEQVKGLHEALEAQRSEHREESDRLRGEMTRLKSKLGGLEMQLDHARSQAAMVKSIQSRLEGTATTLESEKQENRVKSQQIQVLKADLQELSSARDEINETNFRLQSRIKELIGAGKGFQAENKKLESELARTQEEISGYRDKAMSHEQKVALCEHKINRLEATIKRHQEIVQASEAARAKLASGNPSWQLMTFDEMIGAVLESIQTNSQQAKEARQEATECRAEAKQLRGKLDQLTQESHENVLRLDALLAESKEKEAKSLRQNEILATRVKDTMGQNEQLMERLKAAVGKLKEGRNTQNKSNRQCGLLKAKLQSVMGVAQKLRTGLEVASNKLKDSQRRSNLFEEKIGGLKEQLEQKENAVKTLEAKVEEANRTLQGIQAELFSKSTALESSESKLKTLEDTKGELETQLEELTSKLEDLETENELAASERDSALQEKKKMVERADVLKSELQQAEQKAQAEVKALEKELEAKKSTLTQLKKDQTDLRKQLDEEREEKGNTESEDFERVKGVNEELQKAKAQLERKLSDRDETVSKLQDRVKVLQSDMVDAENRYKSSLKEVQEQLDSTQETLLSTQQSHSQTSNKLTEVIQELEMAREDQGLQETLQAKDGEIIELQEAQKESKQSLERMSQELETARDNIQRLELKEKKMNEDNSSLKASIETLEDRVQKAQEEKMEMVGALEAAKAVKPNPTDSTGQGGIGAKVEMIHARAQKYKSVATQLQARLRQALKTIKVQQMKILTQGKEDGAKKESREDRPRSISPQGRSRKIDWSMDDKKLYSLIGELKRRSSMMRTELEGARKDREKLQSEINKLRLLKSQTPIESIKESAPTSNPKRSILDEKGLGMSLSGAAKTEISHDNVEFDDLKGKIKALQEDLKNGKIEWEQGKKDLEGRIEQLSKREADAKQSLETALDQKTQALTQFSAASQVANQASGAYKKVLGLLRQWERYDKKERERRRAIEKEREEKEKAKKEAEEAKEKEEEKKRQNSLMGRLFKKKKVKKAHLKERSFGYDEATGKYTFENDEGAEDAKADEGAMPHPPYIASTFPDWEKILEKASEGAPLNPSDIAMVLSGGGSGKKRGTDSPPAGTLRKPRGRMASVTSRYSAMPGVSGFGGGGGAKKAVAKRALLPSMPGLRSGGRKTPMRPAMLPRPRSTPTPEPNPKTSNNPNESAKPSPSPVTMLPTKNKPNPSSKRKPLSRRPLPVPAKVMALAPSAPAPRARLSSAAGGEKPKEEERKRVPLNEKGSMENMLKMKVYLGAGGNGVDVGGADGEGEDVVRRLREEIVSLKKALAERDQKLERIVDGGDGESKSKLMAGEILHILST
ncbi:hypothetical protein AAMO2058_000740400 [Amorphochlora amoebiformis]